MNPFNNKILLLFLMLITLLFMATSCDANGFLLDKTHVRITNELGEGIDLSIHCKSSETDLNQTLIHHKQYFEFVFRPYFWGTTQFFCWFHWWIVHHYFDIYVQSRDYIVCKGKCWWVVKSFDGPCMLNPQSKQYDICYPWNKDSNSTSNVLV